MVARLRGSAAGRTSWALDITTDLGVPAVVALSADKDGYGLACGFAARPGLAEAATAATLEMAQIELGLLVARIKQGQGGDAALATADRRHIERAGFEVAALPILQPVGDAGNDHPAPDGPAGLIAHLAALGIGLWLADLSRPPLRLPVMRAVAPALQPFPSAWIGPRLAAARRRHGGGPGALGIALL
jgi:ribosomal protein S12 methylthiotransferase accessory factor